MSAPVKTVLALALSLTLAGGLVACKKHNIKDVDPTKAGRVRSLGPESQDVLSVTDQMLRSLAKIPELNTPENPPIIAMLPMTNNTRHAFNQEIFSTLLKAELNKQSEGKYKFVSRDLNPDVIKEREMKRQGQVDYDPAQRAQAMAGVDYFLVGRADGLANVSTKGQSDTILYSFKLVDSETGIDLWEDTFMTKKEGKDDLLYR